MTEETVDLQGHPIIITLQDAVAGNGFLARIKLSGRTLMRHEDGKWWMYGVQPSGVAASGNNVAEAFLNFRNRYQAILFDIAAESKDFSAFKQEVENFFNEADTDNEDERMWNESLKAIRSKSCYVPDEFAELQRKSPEAIPVGIAIERVEDQKKLTPEDNHADGYYIAKAA
jgi:predicted RNase H-like HicB family nuclease